MAFSKVFALIAFVVVAQAQVIPVPVSVKGTDAEYDPHPQYNFEYSVHDPITGDNKAQQESRDGDVVQGSYSLVEADGSLRTVQYTADAVSGFNAVVSRSGEAVASPAVPALAPVIAAKVAPVHYLKAAPTAVIRTQAAPTAVIRTHAAPTALIRTSLSPAPIYPYKSSATLLPYNSYPYNTYPQASLRYTGYPSGYLSGNPSAYLSGYPSGYPYSAYPSHGYSAPVSTY